MYKVKVLKVQRGAKYKKGDILLVHRCFNSQSGGKYYYDDTKYSLILYENEYWTFIQEIPRKHCQFISYYYPKRLKLNENIT